MLREVRLYGYLGRKYGRVHYFDVNSPSEAYRALRANFPKIEQDIGSYKHGFYVFVGKRNLGANDLAVLNSSDAVIKFIPRYEGAKGGALQIIAGAIITIIGAYTDQPWLIGIGVNLMVGGVAKALIRAPNGDKTPDDNTSAPSYAFNGPVNTSAQGHIVPVIYGRLIVGSQVISAGTSAAQIALDEDDDSDGTSNSAIIKRISSRDN